MKKLFILAGLVLSGCDVMDYGKADDYTYFRRGSALVIVGADRTIIVKDTVVDSVRMDVTRVYYK